MEEFKVELELTDSRYILTNMRACSVSIVLLFRYVLIEPSDMEKNVTQVDIILFQFYEWY